MKAKPFGSIVLFLKYIEFYFISKNKHHAHSPFLYSFITNVLLDKKKYPEYHIAEDIRKQYLLNKQKITVKDYGAGSVKINTTKRKVSDIAKTSLKPKKLAQLLFKISKFYNCKNILELGTSLGVTTSYLALSNNTSAVLSIEGSYEISKLASTTLKNQRFKNITLLNGTFEEVLPNVLKNSHQSWDFVFLDGNHRYIATKEYFNQILPYLNENSIVVLDDIHWSKEMEKAWKEIYTLKEITLSIDLFFMGIVFFNKNLTKQHFNIRFNPFF